MAGVTVNNVTITGITVGFTAGQISTVQVAYQAAGPAGEVWPGVHAWQLSPAESGSAAATGFVAALVAKLAAVTGLAVATT